MNIKLKSNSHTKIKNGIIIGLIIGCTGGLFLQSVTNPYYKEGSTFKPAAAYFANKFKTPAVGDWVTYKITYPYGKTCQNMLVGKLNGFSGKDQFNITQEGRSECDSTLYGNFKASIHSVVYPELEITPLSWIVKKFRKVTVYRIESLESVKETKQFYQIRAFVMDSNEKYLTERAYLLKRDLLKENNQIKMSSYYSFGAGNGWGNDVTLNRLAGTSTFEIEKNRFVSGKIHFIGNNWEWSNWNYEIGFGEDFSARGLAYLSEGKIHTIKLVTNKSDRTIHKVRELITPITESEYLEQLKKSIEEPATPEVQGFAFI
jgi:hypothetical protein